MYCTDVKWQAVIGPMTALKTRGRETCLTSNSSLIVCDTHTHGNDKDSCTMAHQRSYWTFLREEIFTPMLSYDHESLILAAKSKETVIKIFWQWRLRKMLLRSLWRLTKTRDTSRHTCNHLSKTEPQTSLANLSALLQDFVQTPKCIAALQEPESKRTRERE